MHVSLGFSLGIFASAWPDWVVVLDPLTLLLKKREGGIIVKRLAILSRNDRIMAVHMLKLGRVIFTLLRRISTKTVEV